MQSNAKPKIYLKHYEFFFTIFCNLIVLRFVSDSVTQNKCVCNLWSMSWTLRLNLWSKAPIPHLTSLSGGSPYHLQAVLPSVLQSPSKDFSIQGRS